MTRGPWRPPWDRLRGDSEGSDPATPRPEAADGEPPAPGVLATLQTAYDALNTRPYLIVVPLALDLAFWLGPQVRSPALYRWFARWPAESGGTTGRELADALIQAGGRAEVTSGLAQAWNLFAVNTLTGSLGREGLANAFDRPAVELGPWYVAALVLLALALGGFWLKTLFVGPLAQTARQEPFAPGAALRASGRLLLRILALYAAVAGMVLLVLIPVGIVGAATMLAGLDALGWVLLAALIPVAWVFLYASFAVDALMLDGVGPIRAAYLSYRVVRRNLWATIGFVSVTLFVSWALPLSLGQVAAQPVGAALVIVAHAYVAAWLALASLLFYRERRARIMEPA